MLRNNYAVAALAILAPAAIFFSVLGVVAWANRPPAPAPAVDPVPPADPPPAPGEAAQPGVPVGEIKETPTEELTEKQLAVADEAVSALERIDAALDVGVSYASYGQLVVDVKASTNKAGRSLPPCKLLTDVNAAIDAYKDAMDLWEHKIRFPNLAKDGLNSKYDGPVMARYKLDAGLGYDTAMQLIWMVAGKRVSSARAALGD